MLKDWLFRKGWYGVCPVCKERRFIRRSRQNTKYVNDEANYFVGCDNCAELNDEYWAELWAELNDEYWAELWAEYYSGLL